MAKENLLQKYTQAIAARDEHIEENKSVFATHKKLVFAIIDAENELRDAVAESGSGVENGVFKVTCTPQTQVVYDNEALSKLLQPDEIDKVVKEVTRPSKIVISRI